MLYLAASRGGPMSATQAAAVATPKSRTRTSFYLLVGIVMIAIALAGFWPSYYGPILLGEAPPARSSHALIHLHSTLFIGWLLLLLGQAILARTGHLRFHLRIGPWLAVYGYAAAAVGLVSGVVLAARTASFGRTFDQAASFAFVTITDILTFVGFLTAAVVLRRRPETHKRLMLLAGWSVAIVGFYRLLFGNLPWIFEYRLLITLITPLPAMLGIAHDLARGRRPHLVWWIGLIVFVLWANRRIVAESETWLSIGRQLIRPFA
jgi:hypothetical protein